MENRMSDNQRRLFCRLLFLFFCCLPTAIIVYRACHRPTPDFWQQQILANLGFHTRLNSVETLSPHETILRDVTVFDGYGYPVLSAIEVDLNFSPGRHQIVIRDQIRLSNQGLKYLAQTLNSRLIQTGGCSVVLNDVVLTSTQAGLTQELRVSPVKIISTPTADGTHASLTLRMKHAGESGDHSHSTVHCNFDRIAATGQTQIHVETNQLAVPCWLADQWLPTLQELGPGAGFAGRFFIAPKEDRLHGWVDGQFTDVDLADAYGHAQYGQEKQGNAPLAMTGRPLLGQIELHTSFPLLPENLAGSRDPRKDYAILKLPDGSTQPIIANYEMRRVFDVSSAIGNTVRTARTKSVINY